MSHPVIEDLLWRYATKKYDPSKKVSYNFQPLPKSFKNLFPFKICTTSFIYPAGYIENARRVGPFVDEMELLVFETPARKGDICPQYVDILKKLGEEFDFTYNIHLPTDICLSHTGMQKQKHAAKALTKVINLISPLSPSSYILHLPFIGKNQDKDHIKKWRKRTEQGLLMILEKGIDSELVAIENLDYPFEWIYPAVEKFNFSVCMDMGHLFLYGYDVGKFFDKYKDKIAMIHLHGVKDGKDHIALDCLAQSLHDNVINILKKFKKTVSLEIFSYNNLISSLNLLEKWIL